MISLLESECICNIYMFVCNMRIRRWSNSYEAELYVYGESYGVIWDTSVNYSTPSDQLIVVGAFDTVSKTSQVQYCSVGVWTGISFNKVGEGLCPRGGGSSAAMMIQSSVLGDNGTTTVFV